MFGPRTYVIRYMKVGRVVLQEGDTRSGLQSLLSKLPANFLLVWLLTLPAISPFFQPTLPHSADGLLHLYRVVALDHALGQGVLFPRWLPDLAFGYGLPLFVFYAPLSYFFTAGMMTLCGPTCALNASLALALLAAGSGMYLFVKDMLGPKAGILAGVAYVYAPYQLFNALSRGSLPAVWSAAVFPFAFWAFGRLRQTKQSRYLVLSALISGLALSIHNISNLLFFPLLLFYLVVDFLPGLSPSPKDCNFSKDLKSTLPAYNTAVAENAAIESSKSSVRLNGLSRLVNRYWQSGLAVILGIGLAAFFWLPAVAEKGFVQIDRVITPPDFDFHAHFVSFEQLFLLPPPANTGLLNPSFPLTLGLVQLGLAAVGVLGLALGHFRGRKNPQAYPTRFSRPIVFGLVSLVIAIFMMLPISVGVWERLPLIAFVQHPNRFLGVAAFLLAMLAGMSVVTLPERQRLGGLLVGIGLLFISAVPLLYPRYYDPLPAPPTPTGMMTYERSIGAIGTTSFGEYLPVWVRQIPRESPLEPVYQSSGSVERLDAAYLPQGASIETSRYSFNQAEVVIDSPQPYRAVFHTFFFPGWQATVDARSVPVRPVTERGLIGIEMPAGRHRLQLFFTKTPIRSVADGISLGALIILTLIAAADVLGSFNNKLRCAARPRFRLSPLTATEFMSVITLALTLILTKAFYLDHYDHPLKRVFNGTTVAGAVEPRQVNFGDQLYLLGYNLNHRSLAAGDRFELTLFWQGRQHLDTNYSILAQLVDDRQNLYGSQDNLHPGGLPVNRWEPGGFVEDPHTVQIPPGTPPGDYFLVTGPYDPITWARLPVIEGGDAGWSDVISIPVTVRPADSPPKLAELGIKWPVVTPIAAVPEIHLLGAAPAQAVIVRNDFLRLALFWEAISKPEADYQVNLQLVANDGQLMVEAKSHPSHGRYPTTRWTKGERVRDNHAFWIPPDFPAGVNHIRVRLLDGTGRAAGKWIDLGQIGTLD